jgi:hypothetical protein
MIDKLIIRIDDKEIIENIILPKMTANEKFVNSHYSSPTYLGHYKNFVVHKRGDHLKLWGSLAKYALKANCFSGNRQTINGAIDRFCAETGVPDDTTITYLEFGFNIPLEEEVSEYLRRLKYASGYPMRLSGVDMVVFLQEEKKIATIQ